jgi:predicted permease
VIQVVFLQIFTEHQGHLLIRIAVVIAMLLGFIFLFAYFNKRGKKAKSDKYKVPSPEERRKKRNAKRQRGKK